ncbi:hypothetical protein GHT07_06775 [Caenimonas koreensis DSM 17982]|uniref:Uncharacterized protein n=1 Tax=Caenimonas koreensis DSM 17982 TaxID=1121255 RepID=A0A844ASC0_9BURK|nr:hypothetical protein [Caenimonas koreensis]MRD46974.1 hypothetical protein [Caenimonas koreensis DSM 17982]
MDTSHNDAGTFALYDPSKIVGDTSPYLALPPQPSDNFFGQVLMMAVALYVSLYLGPQTLSAVEAVIGKTTAATVIAGAASAAAGSVASQALGVATGVQDKFNWKSVGASLVSGGVSAGINGITGLDGVNVGKPVNLGDSIFNNVIGKAVLANGITQGVGIATGLQRSFNWNSVTASAVGAGVGAAVGRELGDGFGGRLATGLIAGTATAVMRGGRISAQQIAVDAFGQVLGQSIAYGSSGSSNPVSGYGYRNEMDKASDAYNPSHQYEYRNEMDRTSDNYNPAGEYAYRNGSDIQSDTAWERRINAAILGAKHPDYAAEIATQSRQSHARVANDSARELQREGTRLAELARDIRYDPAAMLRLRPQAQGAYASQSAQTYLSAWDGKSGVYADATPHPFYDTFQYGVAKSLPDAAATIAAPEMLAAKAAPLLGSMLGKLGLLTARTDVGVATGTASRVLSADTAASVNQARIAAGDLPSWLNGTIVTHEIVPIGTRYNMVVSEGQAAALMEGKQVFGGFATPGQVTTQAFARDKLVILDQFKADVSRVVTVETTAPQLVNRGLTGPLETYSGGVEQVQFLGARNLRVVEQPRVLR